MRALRFDRYGTADVIRVEELAEPQPGPGEVTVRVRAASINPLDWKIRAGQTRMIPRFRGPPRGLGCDFAGEVKAVGDGVASWRSGTRAFGSLLPFGPAGAFAECVVVTAERLAAIPDGVDFDQAAALPIAGGTALQALVDIARLAAGQHLVITGAAGGVGHFAVQLAKHLGARVAGVCSEANSGFVRSLGADETVDYAREDFTRRGDRFDVVFDAAAVSSFSAAARVLTDTGCYINTCGHATAALSTIGSAILARVTSRRRAIPFALKNIPETWRQLAALARDGILHAHVERVVTLDEVAGAMRAMEAGHARGKVVVRP